jgi:hypothetical protein
MDPDQDPGGSKTCGSYGSGSVTLHNAAYNQSCGDPDPYPDPYPDPDSMESGSGRAKITHKSINFFKSSSFEVLDGLF